MYKTELIRRVARETRLSQREVAAVLDAAQQLIARTLQGGQRVTLPGFGTFYTRPRQATRIQHIRTREVITLPAGTARSIAFRQRRNSWWRWRAMQRPTTVPSSTLRAANE